MPARCPHLFSLMSALLAITQPQVSVKRDYHLRHVRLPLAASTLEAHLPKVCHSDQPTFITHMHPIRIRVDEQTISQEIRAAMTDEAISLHLSHTQATVSRSSLHWLPREVHNRSSASAMDLVIHQVLQTLVEGRPQEHLSQWWKKVRGRGIAHQYAIGFAVFLQ